MTRALLMILDGFGIGHAPDAAAFGDEGANTLAHVLERVPLELPHFKRLGLMHAAALAAGEPLPPGEPEAMWGALTRLSGKDTCCGHHELAGVAMPLEPAPGLSLLDAASDAGRAVISIGRIGDIFAHRNTGEEVQAQGNRALFAATLDAMDRLPDGGLGIVNLGDFETLYGHRRDVLGYAVALRALDEALPALLAKLHAGDVLLLTAGHGCDPTFPGHAHTRERVPLLAAGPGLQGCIGIRARLADAGQSLARHLGLSELGAGETFL